MLSCDNICHGGEGLGVRLEEVGVEGLADAEEQLGVDGGLVVEALQGARADADALGKPFVGMALAAQFVANKVAYVYLHIAICCYADGDVRGPRPATDSLSNFQRPQTKKEGEQSRLPVCGRGLPLKGKTKILACQRALAFVIL